MTQDDKDLFRTAMRDVRPLAAKPRAPAAPRPRNRRLRPDPATSPPDPGTQPLLDPRIMAGDELRFIRPGVAAVTLRRLRRGQLPVVAELDLHGNTARDARRILDEFLRGALDRGAGVVRIIHGKGLRSGAPGPVLKQTVDAVLRAHPAVMAFTSANPADGGTGAVYVLLDARR